MNAAPPVTAPAGWSPGRAVERLAARGSRPVVIEVRGETMVETSGEALACRVGSTARALADAGVGPGDVVAIHAANGPGWIATGLACGIVGAVLAPLDVAAPRAEAAALALAAGAKRLAVDGPSDAEAIARLDIGAIPDLGADTAPPAVPLAADAPIALFRTSGTTGAPKIFHLTVRNIGWNVSETAAGGLVRGSDRVLMPLPMHHVFPWIVGVLVTVEVGAVLVLPESAAGPHIATALRVSRPTVVVGVPRLFETLLEAIRARIGRAGRALLSAAVLLQRATGIDVGHALFAPVRRKVAPDLRLLVSGGARLDAATIVALEALGWDVRTGYGLSETAAVFAGSLRAKRRGTEGQPLPGCEIRIENPNAHGVGEILLRGPNVFSGYIGNAAANARAFDGDGFFRTGDLGRVDGDGFLTVTGRAKEVIVLGGGANLYPEDVERKYERAADIREIGVFERDGRLLALVVPDMAELARRGATLRPETAVKVALATVGKEVPSIERLAGFRITRTPLPRTRLGKIRRFLLPQLYDRAGDGAAPASVAAPAGEDLAWLADEPRAAIWGLLREEFRGRPLGLDSDLSLDLGLDSFAWMTLALRIEEATGVRLETGDIATASTVRELLALATRLHDHPAAGAAAADREAEILRQVATERDRWLAPRSAGERAVGSAVLAVVLPLARRLYRLEVVGAERLPQTGPIVVCPNHISDLDAPVIAAALPPAVLARTSWLADRVRVFEFPPYRALCRPLRIFPADERAPRVAVELAAEVLRRGGVQVWFPEGWRSADGRLLPFLPGIGRVVKMTRAPVVPTLIEGTLDAWPRDRRLPHLSGRVRVTFGEPVPASALAPAGDPDAATPQDIASALRLRVADLARAGGIDLL